MPTYMDVAASLWAARKVSEQQSGKVASFYTGIDLAMPTGLEAGSPSAEMDTGPFLGSGF